MKGRFAAAVFAALFFTGQAMAAAPACQSEAEVEADQAMLFKTSLMLMSETCSNRIYSEFTARNKGSILAYQRTMTDMYKRHGDRRSDATFETYMTHLANLEAIKVGVIPIAQYCSASQQTMTMASTQNDSDFRKFVTEQSTKNRGQYTLCK